MENDNRDNTLNLTNNGGDESTMYSSYKSDIENAEKEIANKTEDKIASVLTKTNSHHNKISSRKSALFLTTLKYLINTNASLPEFFTKLKENGDGFGRSYKSEHLTMAKFLIKCKKIGIDKFDYIPTFSMVPFLSKLKKVKEENWEDTVKKLVAKFENTVITKANILKATADILPDEKKVNDAESKELNEFLSKLSASQRAEFLAVIDKYPKALIVNACKSLSGETPQVAVEKCSDAEHFENDSTGDKPKEIDEPQKNNSIFAPIDAEGVVIIDELPAFFAEVVFRVSEIRISRDDVALNALKYELQRLEPLFKGYINTSLSYAITCMRDAVSLEGNFWKGLGGSLESLRKLAAKDIKTLGYHEV